MQCDMSCCPEYNIKYWPTFNRVCMYLIKSGRPLMSLSRISTSLKWGTVAEAAVCLQTDKGIMPQSAITADLIIEQSFFVFNRTYFYFIRKRSADWHLTGSGQGPLSLIYCPLSCLLSLSLPSADWKVPQDNPNIPSLFTLLQPK